MDLLLEKFLDYYDESFNFLVIPLQIEDEHQHPSLYNNICNHFAFRININKENAEFNSLVSELLTFFAAFTNYKGVPTYKVINEKDIPSIKTIWKKETFPQYEYRTFLNIFDFEELLKSNIKAFHFDMDIHNRINFFLKQQNLEFIFNSNCFLFGSALRELIGNSNNSNPNPTNINDIDISVLKEKKFDLFKDLENNDFICENKNEDCSQYKFTKKNQIQLDILINEYYPQDSLSIDIFPIDFDVNMLAYNGKFLFIWADKTFINAEQVIDNINKKRATVISKTGIIRTEKLQKYGFEIIPQKL